MNACKAGRILPIARSAGRGVLLSQQPAQDLVGGGLGDLVHELDLADLLVRRDVLGDVGHQLLGVTPSSLTTNALGASPPSFPESRPLRGREAYKDFLERIGEDWEGAAREIIRELFDAGDRVVMRWDWGGRGRTSGVDAYSSLTGIFEIRDGLIVSIDFHFDHGKALRAIGLGTHEQA